MNQARETFTTPEVEIAMATELARIAEVVEKRPNEKLQTLVHAINVETLKTKHQQMKGKKAAGIDGITKEQYGEQLDSNVRKLVDRMKRQAYKPQSVRRVHIPKGGKGETRPLGIPAYEDKLVQGIMADILNVIYETKFLDLSYGFRPGRSCHDAIKELNRIIERKKVSYIVDADIKGFFDNVDHQWLMEFLKHDIGDKNFLRLTSRFLEAGVMEQGKYLRSDVGTPQGGLISPVLANVYLHYVLDLWFEKKIRKEMRGESYMIRYCDDFICAFQYKEDADKFYRMLKERLGKFKLSLARDKTKVIEFGRFAASNRERRGIRKPETFDFLGFTHYCSTSKRGAFRVKRKTSRKKYRIKVQNMKKWMWERMHTPVGDLIKELNPKLRGHYQYYGITDNSRSIKNFHRVTEATLLKVLRRRSQKDNMTWDKFLKILEHHPIVYPKIYVNVYA